MSSNLLLRLLRTDISKINNCFCNKEKKCSSTRKMRCSISRLICYTNGEMLLPIILLLRRASIEKMLASLRNTLSSSSSSLVNIFRFSPPKRYDPIDSFYSMSKSRRGKRKEKGKIVVVVGFFFLDEEQVNMYNERKKKKTKLNLSVCRKCIHIYTHLYGDQHRTYISTRNK